MTEISRFVRSNSFLLLALAFLIAAPAFTSRAESSAKLEKHARKIEKHLARYRTGTLLEIDFRDNSQATGSLDGLSDATFRMTNSDSNTAQTFNYADVDRVRRVKEYIGAGSESGHHIRLWVPLLVGAIAAGGGIAAYEAMH